MSLANRLSDLATRIATEIKSVRTLVNGNAADLTSLNTTAKANLVVALNEVLAAAGSANNNANSRAKIDDANAASTTTYSSNKIGTLIQQAVAGLVASSPGALDTLKELADAIGDDPNYAASTATALGNRLRFDAAQVLTAAQQTQGQSNLSVYSTAQIGDPETNFVTVFANGLQ